MLPQTPPSTPIPPKVFLSRSYFDSYFTAKVSLFFCLQQKAYLISVPQQTPYLLSAPSTSSVQLFSPSPANQPPRTTTRRSWLQVFLIIKAFFYILLFPEALTKALQVGSCARTIHGDDFFFCFVFVLSPLAVHQRTLMTSLQTASEFTSVCFRLATNMSNMKYCTS